MNKSKVNEIFIFFKVQFLLYLKCKNDGLEIYFIIASKVFFTVF